jgi:predicted polyphosphate/ATP-dependent NAD kinase
MPLVGIIANPASGKDIRRLIAYGSPFDNAEKVRIVRRVLLGLAALGVGGVCYMPDTYGIVERALSQIEFPFPVWPVADRVRGAPEDTTAAARSMALQKAACIVTLGGDGTNRAVVKGTASVPLLPISTGTNNVFPAKVEGTLAGLAAALVARRHVSLKRGTYRSSLLEVVKDRRVVDLALVDAAVIDDPFVGSRAVWDMQKVRQIFLNRAEPASLGLSAIGGFLRPVPAEAAEGLYLELGGNGRAVVAPVAPGVLKPVAIHRQRVMKVGQAFPIGAAPSVLALDGERELEIHPGERIVVRLAAEGPRVIDVDRTLQAAAAAGRLLKRQPKPGARGSG